MRVFQFVSLLALCSVFFVAGYISGINSKPPDNNRLVENVEPPEQSDTVKLLVEDYENNPVDAESKYNGKTFTFQSTVGGIDTFEQSVLEGGQIMAIFCFKRPVPSCENGIDASAYFPNEDELRGLRIGSPIKFEGTVDYESTDNGPIKIRDCTIVR